MTKKIILAFFALTLLLAPATTMAASKFYVAPKVTSKVVNVYNNPKNSIGQKVYDAYNKYVFTIDPCNKLKKWEGQYYDPGRATFKVTVTTKPYNNTCELKLATKDIGGSANAFFYGTNLPLSGIWGGIYTVKLYNQGETLVLDMEGGVATNLLRI